MIEQLNQHSNVLCYSRGKNKYDNKPVQLTAASFAAFSNTLANDLSEAKGQTYICAALSLGPHDDQLKYTVDAHWRLSSHALGRRFIAFDFDGFANPTVFEKLRKHFAQYSALLYTTSSSTERAPRARAIVELGREVNRKEGELLGAAIQTELESIFGVSSINFDSSVYRAEQPIYTPVVGATSWITEGRSIDVDSYLKFSSVIGQMSLNDDLIGHLKSLEGNVTIKDVRSALTYLPPDCDREMWLRVIWGIRHGLGDAEGARDLADQWSMGAVYPKKVVANYAGTEDVMAAFDGYDPDRVDGITVGTVFKAAQDKGWSRESQLAQVAVATPKNRLSVPSTFKLTDGDICIPRSAPPKRDFIFADTVTRGALSVIAGSGGVSKTTLAMQIAASMAVGQSSVGFQVLQGAVVAFLGEEDSQERDRRFGAICQQFNADPEPVVRYVKAFPAAGIDLRLTQAIAGSLCSTVLVDEIIGLVKDHEEAVGRKVELIIVDHARLAMDGDPNDAAHVTQLTRALTHVAQETKAAVVLLCHSPKNVLSKDSDQINASDVAGSSAFVDNARSAFMLYGMRPKDAKAFGISESDAKKYVKFDCVKANYAPTGSVWWFERKTLEDWQTAVLQPANLVPQMFAPGQAKVKLRQAIWDFVSSNPGKSQRQLRLMAGKTKRFGASERDLVEALDVLLDEGRLSLRKPTTDECKRHRITPGKAYLFS